MSVRAWRRLDGCEVVGPAGLAAYLRGPARLTAPAFEREAHSTPALWWHRWRWRRQLRALLAEDDAVLADFGVRRASLRAYVARPPWRA